MKEVNWKFNIGDEIKDDKRSIVIIDKEVRIKENKPDKKGRIYNIRYKFYKYKCLKCGNEDWIVEGDLDRNKGCNTCCSAPQKVVLGINTIWDKARWMCDLGVSEEDAKRYTPMNGSKIITTCPHCGNKKETIIRNIYYRHTIGCICNDKQSYPEKFLYSVLKQLNIKFVIQLSNSTFKWCDNKKYDFYLPDYNCIIETHGSQHYEESTRGRSLKEEQENDIYKMELALNNGIDNYIVVDCRKSELEWIKNSILNSELNNMFNLSNINWLECEKFTTTNLIKIACKYKSDNDLLTTRDISKIMGYHRKTITAWLKIGSNLGWCSYDPNEEKKRNYDKMSKINKEYFSKKVEVFKDGKSCGVFNSIKELEDKSKELFGIRFNNISAVCLGKRTHNNGYTFKYVEE